MARTSNGTAVRCLKPVQIINPHYIKLSKGDKKFAYDNFRHKQDYMLGVSCGKCFLCKKSYQSKWRIRLNHEYMYGNHDLSKSYFVTLTINPANYEFALKNPHKCVRVFLEKYRYQVKKRTGKGRSLFHWIVSERGEEKGRFHFHGIFFDSQLSKYLLEQCWPYGFVSFKRLTLKRCGYVTKYITKGNAPGACQEAVEHLPRVWCSAGIGKCYTELPTTKSAHISRHGLVPFIVKNNFVYGMPRYYKQKIFTEEQLKILKLQYYAECRAESLTPPKPPFSIGRWATSSPEVLLNEIDTLSRSYAPAIKTDINEDLKKLSYEFVLETFESGNSCSQEV